MSLDPFILNNWEIEASEAKRRGHYLLPVWTDFVKLGKDVPQSEMNLICFWCHATVKCYKDGVSKDFRLKNRCGKR